MVTRLRLLDDAAWVSVDDTREVGTGSVWPVAEPFCSCDLAWLVVEAYVEVGVDGRRVEARAHGHCVTCGESGTTDWLAVGRVTDAGFEPVGGTRGSRRGSPASGCRGEC
ncbi:hypothetical protein [Halobacterium jilantaiense]|uniref:DUF8134 domain-containing protein n=1 Tax=Halobacterium jilantaiense TaxID=355548 RepID=A0A1I0PHY3_9EURY|nr:hypothetical protein [Halobacterium jilantaiense]SEW14051.1 hypothetical protein SAMN04487945_1707 [Halobacterium jilantaiense]